MKKAIIGALVGGIIIFIWQFLSWAMLNLHEPQQRYTAKQDSVMAYLNTQFSEDAAYMMPTMPKGTPREEMEKKMKVMEGKPYAMLVYHKSMPGMDTMPMNMARGLAVDFVMVWLLCWLLGKINVPSFSTIFFGSLFTGIIVFLNSAYTMHIWYGSFDLWMHLTDALISWGVTGLWLGWWLRR